VALGYAYDPARADWFPPVALFGDQQPVATPQVPLGLIDASEEDETE
jgi:hypothetical protein